MRECTATTRRPDDALFVVVNFFGTALPGVSAASAWSRAMVHGAPNYHEREPAPGDSSAPAHGD